MGEEKQEGLAVLGRHVHDFEAVKLVTATETDVLTLEMTPIRLSVAVLEEAPKQVLFTIASQEVVGSGIQLQFSVDELPRIITELVELKDEFGPKRRGRPPKNIPAPAKERPEPSTEETKTVSSNSAEEIL